MPRAVRVRAVSKRSVMVFTSTKLPSLSESINIKLNACNAYTKDFKETKYQELIKF